MTKTIAVAGATGALGTRVVHALLAKGARVQALVRGTSDQQKLDELEAAGATIIALNDVPSTSRALTGTACVVSTLSGLRETIVDAQTALLEAAVNAGVPRFIPSDFAADFTRLSVGDNRNLDLRREFHVALDAAPIRSTSILNGMFADILPTPHSPFFDFKARRVNYWGSPNQRLDFTTMDDTAAYTAAAALDDAAPKILRISGDQISAYGMAEAASEATGTTFTTFFLGSLDELAEKIFEARRTDPTAESTVFAPFQLLQYLHNMASGRAKLDPVENDRYPNLKWRIVKELLKGTSGGNH